jgi:hypothetical protein
MGRTNKANDQYDTSHYSRDALKHIQKVSKIADSFFERRFEDMGISTTCEFEIGVAPPLIQELNRTVELLPDDPGLLFAKSEAYFAIMDEEKGLEYQNKTLAACPNHFDAKMRQMTESTWNHMYVYPGWYSDIKIVPDIMLTLQEFKNTLQIVRDGIGLSLAVLIPTPGDEMPNKIIDAKWKPIWVSNTQGSAFFHYVLFKLQNNDQPYFQELMIDPYPFSTPRPLDGYWILKRLCQLNSVWIVFNDGGKVLFNKKYDFPKTVSSELRTVKKKIDGLKVVEDHQERFTRAVHSHMEESDINEIISW